MRKPSRGRRKYDGAHIASVGDQAGAVAKARCRSVRAERTAGQAATREAPARLFGADLAGHVCRRETPAPRLRSNRIRPSAHGDGTCSSTSSGSRCVEPCQRDQRYNAPLSRSCQPTRFAMRRLMVPLPELDGPSMVIIEQRQRSFRRRLPRLFARPRGICRSVRPCPASRAGDVATHSCRPAARSHRRVTGRHSVVARSAPRHEQEVAGRWHVFVRAHQRCGDAHRSAPRGSRGVRCASSSSAATAPANAIDETLNGWRTRLRMPAMDAWLTA